MGMSEFYGASDEAASIRVIHRALELGIDFLDTSDAYGPHTNEMLVGKAVKGMRDRYVIATKFGIVRDPNDPTKRGFCGRPDYVRASCEASLKRLDLEHIDLYYLHRLDPNVPIEDTIGEMSRLVQEGKVRAIGVSELKEETLRRAHAVHPISALQTEYSLWSRDPENGLLQACAELGIAYVAYSPLGRGFLTGAIRSVDDLAADDWRRSSPRFQGENFTRNLQLADQIKFIAREKGCSPAQLALAWIMAKGEHIFPIPGTKRETTLEDNAGALSITLGQDEVDRIGALFPQGTAAGDRYNEVGMAFVNR
jgi:aryl-alcohol dehydrogenase-like predicted oxidoreductase